MKTPLFCFLQLVSGEITNSEKATLEHILRTFSLSEDARNFFAVQMSSWHHEGCEESNDSGGEIADEDGDDTGNDEDNGADLEGGGRVDEATIDDFEAKEEAAADALEAQDEEEAELAEAEEEAAADAAEAEEEAAADREVEAAAAFDFSDRDPKLQKMVESFASNGSISIDEVRCNRYPSMPFAAPQLPL